MGFSLAQASINFVIPAHPADVYTRPIGLLAFLATFAIVASTWYAHHWLFDYLFVPKASTIVVNFATLASLVWLVYQFQLFLHFAPTQDAVIASKSYLLTWALAWLLLGLLYALCLRARWNSLLETDRRTGIFKTGRILTVGTATAAATFVVWVLHQRIEVVFIIIIAAAALYRLAARARGLQG